VRDLKARIEYLETHVLPLTPEANVAPLDEFINAGRSFERQILAVIHGEWDARNVDRRLMNGWSKTAAMLQRETHITLSGASLPST
jgi:hypothetical protein